MKKHEIIYVTITKLKGTELDEERLYMLSGVKVKEYIGGNFQKADKKALKLFLSESTTALMIVSSKELDVKIVGRCFCVGTRNEKSKVFNLRTQEQREELLNVLDHRV